MDLFSSRVMETIFFSLLVFWDALAGTPDNRRSVSNGISPKILIQPESRILFDDDIRSGEVFLTCTATGYPLPTYRWSVDLGLGLREINSTGEEHFRVDTKSGKLTLLKPDPTTHHGVFQCTAENYYGAVLSNTAFIQFGFLRPFPSDPRNHIVAHLGYATTLACMPPQHFPEGLMFEWYKNTVPLNLTTNPDIFMSKDGDLYFSSPKFEDAGVYRCHVSHPKIPSAGVKMSPVIPLLIDRPPTPSSFMRPRVLDNFPKFIKSRELPTTEMEIMLECVGEGSNLTYSWSRANSPLKSGTHNLEDHGRRLLVYVGHNHTDKYNCTVSGALGVASKDLVLSLKELKQKRLSFTKGLKDQDVASGDHVTFECETSIRSMVTWFYNGQKFGPGMTNIVEKEKISINRTSDKSSTLQIKSITPEFAGVYQCGAGDIERYVYSTAHLLVDRKYSSGAATIGNDLNYIVALAILVSWNVLGIRGTRQIL